MTYYKILDTARRTPIRNYKWPRHAWTSYIDKDDLVMCRKGWHIVNRQQIVPWLFDGAEVWEVEAKYIFCEDDKCVCSTARLRKKVINNEQIRNFHRSLCQKLRIEYKHQRQQRPYIVTTQMNSAQFDLMHVAGSIYNPTGPYGRSFNPLNLLKYAAFKLKMDIQPDIEGFLDEHL